MRDSPFPIEIDDVRRAADGLRGVVTRTPLLENPEINDAFGGRLLVKAENAQRTGAFKIRGAYWRISNMTSEELRRGVVSYSSGNHALGVARASAIAGTSALIVMPKDAPVAKIRAVETLDAEVTYYDRDTENYADVVGRLVRDTGRVQVPPSADTMVLAGAGTVALEIFEQSTVLDATPNAILTPCGGGGLTASTAIVAQALAPDSAVYSVEPDQFDDTKRSLAAGRPVANPKGRRTICDAIMTPIPNDVTFPVNLALLAGGLTASDEEVRHAMRFAFDHFNIVAEPGAVVGIAAVLSGKINIRNKTVATVVTGGNIDDARFSALLEKTGKQD